MPFEGAGVFSDWTIDLFNDPNDAEFGKALRQFDYKTIADAIIHVQYTAREAGGPLKEGAIENLREYFGSDDQVPSMKLLNVKNEFPSEWHKLINPDNPENGNILELMITRNLFPFRDKMHTLKINEITILARCSEGGDYDISFSPLYLNHHQQELTN
ncbi:hypothetical protein DCC35_11285 [Mangrovivirga cuniculi]|uniref:Tc toxin complex TcA C-terminal TcB-binding domain-containing protein n=1 Tax=Mangrovivirga cuniculi TaxID=2715131 RepID=A0A4D7K7E0_9BACT|nr:hypothetical protein DCC35_11285 [Mangrovivirga cuniculi]